MNVPDSDLDGFTPDKTVLHFENCPLLMQAVERAIKLVSEASSKVWAQDSRDVSLHIVLESRERVSKFYSRKHFLL